VGQVGSVFAYKWVMPTNRSPSMKPPPENPNNTRLYCITDKSVRVECWPKPEKRLTCLPLPLAPATTGLLTIRFHFSGWNFWSWWVGKREAHSIESLRGLTATGALHWHMNMTMTEELAAERPQTASETANRGAVSQCQLLKALGEQIAIVHNYGKYLSLRYGQRARAFGAKKSPEYIDTGR